MQFEIINSVLWAAGVDNLCFPAEAYWVLARMLFVESCVLRSISSAWSFKCWPSMFAYFLNSLIILEPPPPRRFCRIMKIVQGSILHYQLGFRRGLHSWIVLCSVSLKMYRSSHLQSASFSLTLSSLCWISFSLLALLLKPLGKCLCLVTFSVVLLLT